MITALVSLLVLISLGLIITVPVALATPENGKIQKVHLIKFFKLG